MRNAGLPRADGRDEGEVRACRRLWASVVRTAADDLHVVGRLESLRADGLRRKALAWVESEDVEVGSFLWCCDVLDLNAQAVRRAIENGKALKSRGVYSALLKQFNDEPDQTSN